MCIFIFKYVAKFFSKIWIKIYTQISEWNNNPYHWCWQFFFFWIRRQGGINFVSLPRGKIEYLFIYLLVTCFFLLRFTSLIIYVCLYIELSCSSCILNSFWYAKPGKSKLTISAFPRPETFPLSWKLWQLDVFILYFDVEMSHLGMGRRGSVGCIILLVLMLSRC